MNMTLSKRWAGWSVQIAKTGDVTLRRPSGRAVGWSGGSRKDPDGAAAEFLQTFPGTILIDKRQPQPAAR